MTDTDAAEQRIAKIHGRRNRYEHHASTDYEAAVLAYDDTGWLLSQLWAVRQERDQWKQRAVLEASRHIDHAQELEAEVARLKAAFGARCLRVGGCLIAMGVADECMCTRKVRALTTTNGAPTNTAGAPETT